MSRSDDYLLTAEELRIRRTKRRRLILGAIVLALVLVLGAFSARPASHAIKRWQARRHAEKAFDFIATEKWNEAQKEATAAWQLAPNEPEATRAVARFLSRVRQAQALEFWDRLAQQQPLTRDDLRDEAGLALALGETDRAARAIDSLMASAGRNAAPGDWLLEAQLEAQRGAPNEAAAALRHVRERPEASAREQLQTAVLELRLSLGDPEQNRKIQAEAWERIEKLGKANDPAGLDALVLLAQRALASPISTSQPLNLSTAQLAEALEAHPLAKTPQKLLAIDLRIHASPNEKEAFIQSAIKRWQNADNDSLAPLATWLNGKGEFQRQLDAIPLPKALQTRDLFLQRLDALGALGRWAEIKRLLQNETFPLDPVIEHMYLARCNQQLGEITAGENNWQRALESAAGDPQKLLNLADYAQKNGATAIAASAYDTALGSAPKLRVAWQGKLRLAQASRETKKIHAVLAQMLRLWPNDTAIQNDEAYLRLLLAGAMPNAKGGMRNEESEQSAATSDQEPGNQASMTPSQSAIRNPQSAIASIEQIAQIAQDLVRREPASLPHRTLLALVYLKQNRPATALGVYQDLQVPTNALTPSALAVHAAVLAANGNADDAAKEAAQVPRSALLPEEQTLISGL